jgi:hypothetical protein
MLKNPLILYLSLLNTIIMAQTSPTLLNPFRIDIDPMERLLLVNFEKDPDRLYIGLEPQVFDDPVNGKGHLVIAWRADGKVDVYHQESLRLDPAKYDIAGKGLANMAAVPFEQAYYEVTESGVQAHYAFRDLEDRPVRIRIAESSLRKRKPFGLLAPMGDAAEAPSAMPLVLLQDFYFVRRKHTEFEISIDGKPHQPDELPMPMDFAKMYFARYSPRPLIATLNPAIDGPMALLPWDGQSSQIDWEGHEISLAVEAGQVRIRQIVCQNEVHPVRLAFEPPFPDLRALPPGSSVAGSFTLEGHPSTGRITGRYKLTGASDGGHIRLMPTGGWEPKPTKFSTWFLFTVGKIFKNWPKTYEWNAVLRQADDGGCHMTSAWKRIRD